MFVSVDQNGEKQFAFHEDKVRLYSLAQAKELYCPHCQKHVFFRGGAKRIHHFYHECHVECSFVGEPETQEHLGGKLAIYYWLKSYRRLMYFTSLAALFFFIARISVLLLIPVFSTT